MKLDRTLAKNLLLFFTPVVTSLSVAAAPSLAATFASSEGSFLINNYSQSPKKALTSVDTDTLTIAINRSSLTAQADADAYFFTDESPLSTNSSLSLAFGKGSDYSGLAKSQADVVGDFLIKAGESFSFDFVASLFLNTKIDNPPAEGATASGELSLLLFDSTDKANPTLLDFFTVSGNLATPENNDFLTSKKSDAISLDQNILKSSFGGNQESARAELAGSYLRSFNKDTHLTLIETKNNKVTVKAPEPSTTLALLLFFVLTGVGLKAKSKHTAKPVLTSPGSGFNS